MKKNTELPIPLVVFGHMHKELAYGNGLRKMVVVGTDDTIYLNGAVVPRVKCSASEQGSSGGGFVREEVFHSDVSKGTLRAFTVIDIKDGRVEKITESWVAVSGETTRLQEEQILFDNGNDRKSNSESSPSCCT